jgi:hypothetical protein
MISGTGIIYRAAEVCADGGKTAKSIALANQEDALILEESDGTIGVILRLSSLEGLARLEEDIRNEESHGAGGGGSHCESACKPSARELQEASAGNVVVRLLGRWIHLERC